MANNPFSIPFDLLNDLSDTELLRKGLVLYQHSAVTEYQAASDYVRAKVNDRGRVYQVVILRDGLDISTDCSCDEIDEEMAACPHIVAVMLELTLGSVKQLAANPVFAQGMRPIPRAYSLVLWKTPAPGEVEAEYRELLARWTVKDMRDLAACRGITLGGLKRDGIFEMLVKGLVQEDNLTTAIGGLPADSLATLALVTILGRQALQKKPLTSILPYLDAALASGISTETRRSAELCLEDLLRAGLVFQLYDGLTIPAQVMARRVVAPQLFSDYSGAISREEKMQPDHFSHLAMVLTFLGRSGVLEVNKRNWLVDRGDWPFQAKDGQKSGPSITGKKLTLIAEASLKKASNLLHRSEGWIEFCAQTLDAAGFWIDHDPRQITMGLIEWLQKTPAEQGRFLFDTVAGLPSSFEFQSASEEAHFSVYRANPYGLSYQQFLDALAFSRIHLIDLLSKAPTGRWLAITPLLQILHGLLPYLFAEPDLRALPKGKRIKDDALPLTIKAGNHTIDWLDFNEWLGSYGAFFVKVISQTLVRLGFLEIGWRGSQPVALRITSYGEYLLKRKPDYSFSPAKREAPILYFEPESGFTVNLEQADSELINLLLLISAPSSGKPPTSNAADSKSAVAERADRLVINLIKDGLQYAFNSGWSLEKIVTVLEQALGQPLAGEIRKTLDVLWIHNGRLHIYQDMALVEFADDYCLPELMAGTRLNRILLYAFSPRVVAVNPAGVDQWLAELQEKGYTPKIERRS